MTESNKERPLVSVCIVTYQHADYIAQCIDSVLAQEIDFPIEIIIGEDESTDGTREICKKYAEQFPELIRLFLRSRNDVIYVNGLPTGTFNFTENLRAARGKYIALLEGDDYWIDTKKLKRQTDILNENNEFILSHHWQKVALKRDDGYEVIDRLDHGYLPQTVADARSIFDNSLRIKTRTLMFRNVVTENFIPYWYKEILFGDVALSFILGTYGKFHFIDEPMAVYRITGSGSSSSGLEVYGPRLFTEIHLKNWIRIWDRADELYNQTFHKEAQTTLQYFYSQLIKNSGKSPTSILKTSLFILFRKHSDFLDNFRLYVKVLIDIMILKKES